MKLSEEQFLQTVAALGYKDTGPSRETRNSVRMPMGTRAKIIPTADDGRGNEESVLLLNISESGVGILNLSPMPMGSTFVLRLPAEGRRPAGALVCAVVHSQRVSNGMYAIGAQFTRVVATHSGAVEFDSAQNCPDEDLDHIRQVEDRLSQLSL